MARTEPQSGSAHFRQEKHRRLSFPGGYRPRVYVGDFPGPGWDDGERQEYEAILSDVEDPDMKQCMLHRLSLNPKIELDGGSVVWGMQCWWGAESRWEEMVRGREVVTVDVPD